MMTEAAAILYSDDRIAVCVKPPGVLSTDEPGGMPSLLREALGDGLVLSVHRLDRAVGGLMVYARTRRAAADLSRQMQSDLWGKTYLAVVRGRPDPARGTMRDYLLRDRQACMTYVVPANTPHARPAALAYQTVQSRDGMSLLAIHLHTGRTHQIRCQLAARGLPIDGDRKYGRADSPAAPALWSYRLSFLHPRTEERLTFCQPPPPRAPWTSFTAKECSI